ncbi:ADP-ribosylation factor-related protein 1 [Amphibalanus amphitrite]|uniref:ADP-ribosylation factor-related protein 1 n=1 Tax=Amphibalanus amphitrite TaxID=1232801 RepID=A0A6A4W6Y4_AMPAM|nr:ADP-ribosylation factor-related protein 1 [Amphibalanus amphitrite]
MYTLLSGLYKHLVQKDDYFLLILGLDNAGKSTYLEAAKTKFKKDYKSLNASKITTTVGLNIGQVDVSGIRINFWDLGGQEDLQSLWDKYYAECHAVIYVVDSADRERMDESKEVFDRVIGSEHLIGVPLFYTCGPDGVHEGIDWLVECVKRNAANRPPKDADFS